MDKPNKLSLKNIFLRAKNEEEDLYDKVADARDDAFHDAGRQKLQKAKAELRGRVNPFRSSGELAHGKRERPDAFDVDFGKPEDLYGKDLSTKLNPDRIADLEDRRGEDLAGREGKIVRKIQAELSGLERLGSPEDQIEAIAQARHLLDALEASIERSSKFSFRKK